MPLHSNPKSDVATAPIVDEIARLKKIAGGLGPLKSAAAKWLGALQKAVDVVVSTNSRLSVRMQRAEATLVAGERFTLRGKPTETIQALQREARQRAGSAELDDLLAEIGDKAEGTAATVLDARGEFRSAIERLKFGAVRPFLEVANPADVAKFTALVSYYDAWRPSRVQAHIAQLLQVSGVSLGAGRVELEAAAAAMTKVVNAGPRAYAATVRGGAELVSSQVLDELTAARNVVAAVEQLRQRAIPKEVLLGEQFAEAADAVTVSLVGSDWRVGGPIKGIVDFSSIDVGGIDPFRIDPKWPIRFAGSTGASPPTFTLGERLQAKLDEEGSD